LIINYFGQGAWLMSMQNNFLEGQNPFFKIMPEWFLLVGISVATLAAIIASQALISGSFTLINEAISLNFWPRVTLKNPTNYKGQIYIPSINLLLWVGCVGVVLYFQNSAHMEAAYGLAITLAMMMTTLLLMYYLYYRLKFSRFSITIIFLVFAFIELSFFIANIKKFPEGGFVTLIISSIFFTIMYIIYFGRKLNNNFTKFVSIDKFKNLLVELSADISYTKYATHLVYLTKADRNNEIEEKIVKSIFAKRPKRADIYWFLHINRTDEPFTLDYEVHEILDDKVIKIVLNVGFRIQPKVELYFKKIVQELIEKEELNLHLKHDGSSKYNDEPDFKFVILEKFLSVENEFSIKDSWLLNSYFILKRMSVSDTKAFGLDKSDVIVEELPIIYQPTSNITLIRKK
jgi:KUP system potassium uptake protein